MKVVPGASTVPSEMVKSLRYPELSQTVADVYEDAVGVLIGWIKSAVATSATVEIGARVAAAGTFIFGSAICGCAMLVNATTVFTLDRTSSAESGLALASLPQALNASAVITAISKNLFVFIKIPCYWTFFCKSSITASNKADGALVSMTGAAPVLPLADVVPVDGIAPPGIPPGIPPISGGPPAPPPPALVAGDVSDDPDPALPPWVIANISLLVSDMASMA